jgi:RNA-binding protein YlmH
MHRARFWGGFAQAERCCLLLFPDYAIDLAADGGEDATVAELLSFCGEQDPVSVLQVTGSGFCKLSHRDYLGSLLSLGLEREVLGDIVLADEQRAYVFCRAAMAAYITEALERVGGDRVNVRAVTLDATFEPQRKVQPIHDTVASARLDCVVASLINCSREVAQTVIRDGRVELDFRVEQRVDHAIATPATISVRGVGKFRVLSVATQTKKGRYRLSAEKYV